MQKQVTRGNWLSYFSYHIDDYMQREEVVQSRSVTRLVSSQLNLWDSFVYEETELQQKSVLSSAIVLHFKTTSQHTKPDSSNMSTNR